ncbi:MAG: helix-turn-helix domain-containing protein [Bacteroidota bacterium]
MWIRRETILPAGIDRQQLARAGQDMITNSVLEYFDLTFSQVTDRTRKLAILIPRHFIHYFLTVLDDKSFREIGFVTGLDHATVTRSRDMIENWIETDKHFRVKCYAIANLIILNNNTKNQQNNESTDM